MHFLFECHRIYLKSTNWGHYCYVPYWKGPPFYMYVVIWAMQRSSHLQSKGGTFIS